MGKVKRKYQKAVKLTKVVVVAMEAIDPAAKTHCAILRNSPVKVPGVPAKSFIFNLQNKFPQKKKKIPTPDGSAK